ncbi:MAG: hypothetical protein AAF585_06760, partial [Verrucomicrobiota bacterium]
MAATTRLFLKHSRIWLLLVGFALAALVSQINKPSLAQEPKPKAEPTKKAAPKQTKKKENKPALEAIALKGETRSIKAEGRQIDFPSMDKDGSIAFVEWDGNHDIVKLAKPGGEIVDISERGIVHQPALAVSDSTWVFWGEIGEDDLMHLVGRCVGGKQVTVAANATGADSFAHAGVDSEGRVWVTWQSLRAGQADVFARWVDAEGNWSDEIAVAATEAGEWEPRIAFDENGNAWIAFESSAGNEFNLHLACVSADGEVKTWPIAHTERYEARPDIVPAADGSGFWIAAERGRVRWGLDLRGHGNAKGLNAQKEILFGKFDIASEAFTAIPLGPAGEAGAPVNLPAIGLRRATEGTTGIRRAAC